MEAETTLFDAGQTMSQVYFPETGVISVVSSFSDGSAIEVANIGREGCSGMGVIFGNIEQPVSHIVQVSGKAFVMDSQVFQRFRRTIDDFDRATLAAAQGMLYQIMVSGACNIRHGAKQRLARWLLTMCNRSGTNVIDLTQDFLGHVLGVRRATISQALTDFASKGLIRNRRGSIEVLSLERLQIESCECFSVVREAYDRILKDRYV